MEATGIIFNIQKFSLHDGPGIRTLVFFKGCPLRCRWCANPESQSARREAMHDFREHREKVTGEKRTVAEVVRVCMQDEPFYEESGGGVTLSGGEALMQPDFCVALLAALKERGVHTAVETTGCAAPEVFDRAARYTDLFLFDVKHWDGERHREGTGVANGAILANLRRAIAGGLCVLPRIPVIPGFNDSPADAEGFARLLRGAGAREAQLLPFHQFGERKYEELGRAYAYRDVPALHEDGLEPFRQAMVAGGIRAFF